MIEVKFDYVNFFGSVIDIVRVAEAFAREARRAVSGSQPAFSMTWAQNDTIKLVLKMEKSVYDTVFVPRAYTADFELKGGKKVG